MRSFFIVQASSSLEPWWSTFVKVVVGCRLPTAVNQMQSDAESWNSPRSGRICTYPILFCSWIRLSSSIPLGYTCKWSACSVETVDLYDYQNILGRLLAPACPPAVNIKSYNGLLYCYSIQDPTWASEYHSLGLWIFPGVNTALNLAKIEIF